MVADLDGDAAQAVADGLPGSQAVALDVSDEGAVKHAVEQTCTQMGGINHVVNGAGYVLPKPFEDIALEEWNRLISVHVTGTFLVCRETLPTLCKTPGASIVNIASIAGLVGRDGGSASYAAAKGAILALSRQLAIDYAGRGVRVNTVAPGPLRTAMVEGFVRDRGLPLVEGLSVVAQGIPMGVVGEPEDAAAPVCFLMSEDAKFITGTCVVPDGGLTAA